jgi:hypothetical protein
LGDETTFALMVEILPQMITMVSEINNLLGLNEILHGVNIGNKLHHYNNLNQFFKGNLGKVVIFTKRFMGLR